MRSNVEFWRTMHQNDYFENHPCYLGLRDFVGDEISLIEQFMRLEPSTRVVVIGSGYGRESLHIARRVGHVYGIDVSWTLLYKASQYLKDQGITNFTPVLADSYDDTIPGEIDLVFSIVVMQHLTRDLVREYFQKLAKKLSPSGMFVVQFLEDLIAGATDADAEMRAYEPSISWSLADLSKLCKDSELAFREVRTYQVTETALWHWACFTKVPLGAANLAPGAS